MVLTEFEVIEYNSHLKFKFQQSWIIKQKYYKNNEIYFELF